jgi:hypothetical protein
MCKSLRFAFFSLLIVAMCALSAMAQSTTTGAITGLVTNPNKEVVPGAMVTAKNADTNKEDTATSDDEGRFKVVNLQPGRYSLTVNAPGFAASTVAEVIVEVGRPTNLDVPLSVQGVTGTVQVTADAPVINTSQPDFSSNINQTAINELPINGRRWSQFALGAPGTTPDGGFGLVSFRGISGLLNNNTIDGGDNNQAFFSEERGRTRINYVIGLASIREFQVNTSNFSAEYGRAAGGVVNAVTKSGTNQFHGTVFYYDRDNKWGARNPAAFQTILVGGVQTRVVAKPPDKRQQFGGVIGGPIVKDKAFFFFSYDQQKRNFPSVSAPSSPSFYNTVNRSITGAGLKAPNRLLTDAQIDAAVAFLTSLNGTVPRRGDQRIIMPKIDWHVNDKNTLTATYNRMRWASPAGIQTGPVIFQGKASFGDDFVRVDSLNIRLASTIGPELINEARFQWGKDWEFQNSQPPATGEPLTGPNGKPPQMSITQGFTFGKPNFLERTSYPDERRWQYADTVTLTKGNHTFKWGGDVNFVKDTLGNLFREEGEYAAFSNINDFIMDYTNWQTGGIQRAAGRNCSSTTRVAGQCYNGSFSQNFGPTKFVFSTQDYNFFVQDDWRYTPRLTVNLGLRYEFERMPNPQIPNSLANRAGQTFGPEQTKKFPSDKNNFGPRFGFAWDVTGDGKNSLRGGYGIYYGRVINSTISNAITNTGSSGSQLGFSCSVTSVPISPCAPVFPNTLAAAPTGPSGTPNIIVFNPGFVLPMIHEADLVYERLIARNTVFSASYLFSAGRRLPTFIDSNLPAPTTRLYTIVGGPANGQTITVPFFASARPDTRFGAITAISSAINSKYDGLVLQVNRRLTNGLQFDSSYTLSRSKDNGQFSQTFTAQEGPNNPLDLSLDQGPSNFDLRHKFTTAVIWRPVFFSKDQKAAHAILDGFSLAPIIGITSGAPYSAFVSGSPSQSATGQGGMTGSATSLARFLGTGRNAFRAPKGVNVDMRLSRRFVFKENLNLELIAEGFNIFNRTQVTTVNNTLYTIGGSAAAQVLNFQTDTGVPTTGNPTFGTTSAAGNSLIRERQIQLAVRFNF